MSFKKLLPWIAIALLIIAAVAALAIVDRRQGAARATTDRAALFMARESDHIRGGGADAPVVIVEYSDLQCPACAAVTEELAGIEGDFPGKVAVIYRHFPLTVIHPHAVAAARATEAAALQSRFWEMHDILYARQDEWSAARDPQSLLAAYAMEIGLDSGRFAADLTSDAVADAVDRHQADARTLRLDHTPTIFINGVEIDNADLSRSAVRARIAAILEETSTPAAK